MLGDHIGHKYLRIPVVIYISHIGSHGSCRSASHHIYQCFLKCSIMIIDINVVSFKKIIRHIYIHPTILINIPNRNTQSKSNHASINTRFNTNIRKFIGIVSEKLIPTDRISYKTLILLMIKTANCFERIVQ